MVALAKTKKDLGNLLKYTAELLSINEKIVFDIAADSFPLFPEHAVSGLEGVDLSVDDETWIKIRRLSKLKVLEDRLDALICAWVGTRILTVTVKHFGDGDAAVWLPV